MFFYPAAGKNTAFPHLLSRYNVYTSLLYPVKALKVEEYPDMIHWTMNPTEQSDDGLRKKYGGITKTRCDQPQVLKQEGDHA